MHSITWSGGTIPAGQRDDFTFQSQAPAKATELDWKAYQTYADGSVVNWDQTPTAKESESETAGPYSVTKVVDDLSAQNSAKTSADDSKPSTVLPTALAGLALVVSVIALLRRKA